MPESIFFMQNQYFKIWSANLRAVDSQKFAIYKTGGIYIALYNVFGYIYFSEVTLLELFKPFRRCERKDIMI